MNVESSAFGTVTALPPESMAQGIRTSVAALRRHRLMIVLLVLLVLLTARLGLSLITPTYTADTLLLIDERQTRVVQMADVLSDVRPTRTSLLGEVEVLRSRELAKRVIAQLDLENDPVFSPAKVSRWAWLEGLLPDSWSSDTANPSARLSEAEQRARREAQLLKRFLGKLTVKQVTLSPVIRITYDASSPQLAAAIANAVAEQYLTGQVNAKFDAARRATAWLSERLTELRDKVTASEQAVAAYRDRHRFIEVREGASLGAETLSNLNAQYLTAQAKRAEAEARYELVRRVVAGRGAFNTSGDIAGSSLAQQLREQETALSRKVTEQSNRYGDRHPAIIETRSQLDDVRGKLTAEVRRIGEALKNELDIARSREESLRESTQQAQAQVQQADNAQVGLRDLLREAEASKLIYETFLKRFKETSEQQTLQQPQASILSFALPPLTPSSPRKSLVLGLTLVAALGVAVGLALLLDALDTRLRGAEQVEAATGLPVLGMIPLVHRASMSGDPMQAGVGPAIRTLNGSLRLLGETGGGRALCLTSAHSGDGTSTLAAWLGRYAAGQGEQVLLIHCDSQPSELQARPLHDSLHVAAAQPGEALARQVQQARGTYDLVILDAPPLLTAADARFVAHLADATLVVLRWNTVRPEMVSWPLRQLRSATSAVVGVVINHVDVRGHARYGTSDAGYYFGAKDG